MGTKIKKPRSAALPLLLLLAAVVYAVIRFYPFVSRYLVPGGDKDAGLVPAGNDAHARLELVAQRMSLARDPFVSVPVVPVSNARAAGIEVKGIFWDAGKPMAIINEAVVRIGDVVNNMAVIDIQKDRVILQNGSEYLELRVNTVQ